MADYQKRFYELYQFLAGYFHQDWVEVFDWQGEEPNYRAVVNHFKNTNPRELVKKTADELERFLALPLGDKEIAEATQRLGSCYYPPADGLGERQWLESVLKILREPASASSKARFVG